MHLSAKLAQLTWDALEPSNSLYSLDSRDLELSRYKSKHVGIDTGKWIIVKLDAPRCMILQQRWTDFGPKLSFAELEKTALRKSTG